MNKRTSKIMSKDEATAFIQNMRWFADFGRITAKKISQDKYKVIASRGAFSQFVYDK